MLEGEPSWLAVLEPSAESGVGWVHPPLSFSTPGSDDALRVHLGGEPYRPVIAEREEAAVIFDGVLLDRGPLKSALGSRLPTTIDGNAARSWCSPPTSKWASMYCPRSADPSGC